MKKQPESTKENQSRTPAKPVKMAGEKVRAETAVSEDPQDIINLILRDHKPLKKLIETLKDDEMDRSEKEGSFEQFVPLLVAHAKSEEQSLYVQMKEIRDLRVEGFEGDTEHAIAEQLIHEINATPDDDEWNAKVKVIAELVEHHIEEEEKNILKDVEEEMDLFVRQAIGEKYLQVKTELDLLRRHRSFTQKPEPEHRLN